MQDGGQDGYPVELVKQLAAKTPEVMHTSGCSFCWGYRQGPVLF